MGNFESFGSYEIRGELGRGAMARVWRAWDPNLQREVAIKEPLFDPHLPPAVLEEMARRFVEEGRAAARLSHPGIVTIYDAIVYEGRPGIVMELVNGLSLDEYLSHQRLTAFEAMSIVDQLLDAVGYAHSCGVVHRDIKPANILLDTEGRVKLSDFGIARAEGSSATIATAPGAILGTPGYMSPEQAVGTMVDNRSDLFSVGVVAYEMLTGRNPFGAGAGASSIAVLQHTAYESAKEIPDSAIAGMSVDPRPAIMASLSKNPAFRPQTAREFIAMLHGQMAVPPAEEHVASYVHSVIAGGDQTRTVVDVPSYVDPEPAPPAPAPSQLPSWLPYAIVGGIGLALLCFALSNAMGCNRSGGGSTGGSVTTTLSTDDDNQTTEETEDDTTPTTDTTTNTTTTTETKSPADSLPRVWTGTLDGASQTGSVMTRNLEVDLTEVAESGRISGICFVGYDEMSSSEGKGSYYIDGYVDWESGKVEFYGTGWKDQGGLSNMRRFYGTLSESLDSMDGTCELLGGGHMGSWSLESAS